EEGDRREEEVEGDPTGEKEDVVLAGLVVDAAAEVADSVVAAADRSRGGGEERVRWTGGRAGTHSADGPAIARAVAGGPLSRGRTAPRSVPPRRRSRRSPRRSHQGAG